jgi:hypothetical protein
MLYVDQRHTIAWTTIRRERMLPDYAIGVVEVPNRQHVNLREVVARGAVPARYLFIDAARLLRLRRPDDLKELMLVNVGDEVEEGQPLAGKNPARGRRVFSPVTGVLVFVGEGQIIVQETPELAEVEAGLVGQVVETRPGRGVVIEAYGALVQGVWGNDRRVIGPLRLEPEGGLEGVFDDLIDRQYSGSVLVTRQTVSEALLRVAQQQNIGGIIAPSMSAGLYDQALAASPAILLIQGFGDLRMSAYIANMLEGFVGRQATVDAILPSRWEARRPELFINLPVRSGEHPPEVNTRQALRTGATVRLTRDPHIGSVGQVIDLPKTPQLIDNGLRVPCARVELVTGEVVTTPLANIEVFGR